MAALIAPSLVVLDERHEQVGGIDVLVDVVDDTQPLLIGGNCDGRGVKYKLTHAIKSTV